MKLFTRYNRINLLAIVIIFLLSGISFYFSLHYILVGQVDDDLKIEQHEIETYAAKYHVLPEIIAVHDQNTRYSNVTEPVGLPLFETIQLQAGSEKELYRQLTFYINDNKRWYRVAVNKSLEGTDKLIQSIVSITLVTILLILVVSFLINRLLLRKLWQPFYDTLSTMRGFELNKNLSPHFSKTDIDEFRIMNETMLLATSNATRDYHSLKEFSENAAHELQTPLAIIQSKMDVLIQDEHLSEAQCRAVQSAYGAIQRLSRLNQALLTLAKIENGQYAERMPVNLTEKIADKINQFSEMIALKHLSVNRSLDNKVTVMINPLLTDIILNNLLSNAIKYTKENGTLHILVEKGLLSISNAAQGPALEEDRLFRRFTSVTAQNDGIGLGLAIVKQAAAASGFTACYTFDKGFHRFLLVENNRSK